MASATRDRTGGVGEGGKVKTPHRPRNPRSDCGRVEALVAHHGPSTCDDITTYAPDIPRKRVIMALLSLRKQGRLIVWQYGRRLGRGKGAEPSVYALAPTPAPRPSVRVNSVFALGGQV